MMIINDNNDFTKIENLHLEEDDFNLYVLLQYIVLTNSFKIKSKGLHFEFGFDKRLPTVFKGDPVRISQVIDNLISNAIKFTGSGKIILSVSFVKVVNDQVEINFSISNTGIGFSPEDQTTLIENLSQGKLNTDLNAEWNGSGLTKSAILLRLMKSKIDLTSTFGSGSKFSFSLKLLLGDQDLAVPVKKLPLSLFNLTDYNLCFLIVDDDPLNRIITQQIFKKWGVNTDLAEGGLKAIEMVTLRTYDMILMDLKMPGMDGFETSRNIKLTHNGHGIPIIAMTNGHVDGVKWNMKETGIIDFISKPFEMMGLYEKITSNLTIASHNYISYDIKSESIEFVEDLVKVDIDEIIGNITSGEQTFKNTLISLYIENLIELRDVFTESIENKNADQASRIVHKMNVTLNTLKQKEIIDLLGEGRRIIDGHIVNVAFLPSFVAACNLIIEQLNSLKNDR